MAADRVLIQVQDLLGTWVTMTNVINQDQIILRNMDAAAKQTKKLVRAVDPSGNIVQLGKHPGSK